MVICTCNKNLLTWIELQLKSAFSSVVAVGILYVKYGIPVTVNLIWLRYNSFNNGKTVTISLQSIECFPNNKKT